jgi:HNH endonuclease
VIQLISDDPVIIGRFDESAPSEMLLRFHYLLVAGKRRFKTSWRVLRETEDQQLMNEILALAETRARWHRLELDIYSRLRYSFQLADYLPGQKIHGRGNFSPTECQELERLQIAYGECQRAEINLVNVLRSRDEQFHNLCFLDDCDGPGRLSVTYVHRNGSIWSSRRTLSEDEWIALIDHKTRRDEALLAALTQRSNGADSATARYISVEVRSEVWRRDGGRCTICGSQERLEFDHIIPVTMGGSNTARNIQLLCEQCNREKGASVG